MAHPRVCGEHGNWMFLICLGFPFGGKIAGPGEARSALNFAPLPQFSASACDWPSGLLSPTQIASKDLILLHFFTNRYALHRTVAICPLHVQAPSGSAPVGYSA